MDRHPDSSRQTALHVVPEPSHCGNKENHQRQLLPNGGLSQDLCAVRISRSAGTPEQKDRQLHKCDNIVPKSHKNRS